MTGGASQRMGRDKASMVVGGASLAERAGAVLRAVARPVFAVGPEAGSGLDAIDDPRTGPLVALDEGMRVLLEHGHDGPVVALACDMPLVTAEMLRALAAERRGADAAIPIANGRLQPLCAVYGPAARAAIARAVASGSRSLRDALLPMRIAAIPASAIGAEEALVDVDTPQDLEAVAAILEAPA